MNQRSFQILLVGNDPKTLDTLAAALREDHIALRFAHTAGEALQFFHDRPADLVLVDLEPAAEEGSGVAAPVQGTIRRGRSPRSSR